MYVALEKYHVLMVMELQDTWHPAASYLYITEPVTEEETWALQVNLNLMRDRKQTLFGPRKKISSIKQQLFYSKMVW